MFHEQYDSDGNETGDTESEGHTNSSLRLGIEMMRKSRNQLCFPKEWLFQLTTEFCLNVIF